MERPEKRRRVEEEAADLMSLPTELRLEILYELPTLADVRALCSVNREFREWCVVYKIEADWKKKAGMPNRVRRAIAVRAYEHTLKARRTTLKYKESYAFILKEKIRIYDTPEDLAAALDRWLGYKVGRPTGNVVFDKPSTRFKLVRLIYKLLDYGYAFEVVTTEDEFWHDETIEYLRCVACEARASQQCVGCGVPYCGEACYAENHDFCGKKALRTKKQQRKFAAVMREFKEGTLRSGSGQKVTSRKQAQAIAFSKI